jgi:hypothetical protein
MHSLRDEPNRPRKDSQPCTYDQVIAYRFSDGTDFWAPYPDLHYGVSLTNFSETNDPDILFLENVTMIEEFLHRRLTVATRVRFEMAWEETLSLCELSKLVEEVKSSHTRLLIPIKHNLRDRKITSAMKDRIVNLRKAGKLLRLYIRATEPFVEATTLVYLERLFGEINPKLFTSRFEKQFAAYPFLQKTYPLVKKALNNYSIDIPLSSMILSPNHPKASPSISLQTSFKKFNRKRADEIAFRFNKVFDRLARDNISSEKEFRSLNETIGFSYMTADDVFNRLFSDYKQAINTLSATFEEYIFTPINTPLSLAVEKLQLFEKAKEDVLASMKTKKEDMQSGIFLADTLYAGTSSIQILEDLDHTIRNLEFNPGTKIKARKNIVQAAIMMFFLRVFVLDGVKDCPFSGNFDECEKCILRSRMAKEFRNKIKIDALCPAYEVLYGMNIRRVSTRV